MSQNSFGASLRRRGFEKGRITRGRHKAKHGWKGLRLLSDAAVEAVTAKFEANFKARKRAK